VQNRFVADLANLGEKTGINVKQRSLAGPQASEEQNGRFYGGQIK
jgi:hypothetical protein